MVVAFAKVVKLGDFGISRVLEGSIEVHRGCISEGHAVLRVGARQRSRWLGLRAPRVASNALESLESDCSWVFSWQNVQLEYLQRDDDKLQEMI